MATSSRVITTPPWATRQEFRCCSAMVSRSSASPSPMACSSRPSCWTKGMWTGNSIAAASIAVHGADAAVHRQDLPGDVLAGPRSEQQGRTLQVVVVAEAVERRVGRHLVSPQRGQQALGHLAREEARRQRIDGDAIRAPLAGQGPREVHRRALAGVVGNGLHRTQVARQAGDGGHIDDAARTARDHAGLGHGLREQEEAADVEVHDLVPGLERMLLGRGAPGGAGVVDEDVDAAQALHGLGHHALHILWLGRIGGAPARVDALGLQLGGSIFQVGRLARGQHDLGARLAQGFGDLQAQAARAAGDEGHLAGQVEEVLHWGAHRRGLRVQKYSGLISRHSGSRRATTSSQAPILGSS
mmetsp:Transcript_21087/g.81837  ORF Transcript_21087/g.81837 Transcript_21087/m.81837 type:complete len:357 (+) Transcript_21087:2512-3582(+)